MKASNKFKREEWLDFLKVVSTYLVILLHTIFNGLKDNSNDFSLLFYYIGVFAVPLFFMINGYLQLRKSNDYKYVLKKIFNILFICITWNIPIVIAKIILEHNVTNIFVNVYNNFLQKGFFWQFWFLGALIIIYLLLPFFQKIFKNEKLYKIITLIFVILCVLIDCINIINNHFGYGIIKDNVFQVFRLWTWITYFFLGGAIYNSKNIIPHLKDKLTPVTIIMVIITVLYQFLLRELLYSNSMAENFYDSLIVIITTCLIFITFKDSSFNCKFITKIQEYNLGIYIIHPIFINILKKTIILSNNYINLIIGGIIFIFSLILSYIISKLPFINKCIKI